MITVALGVFMFTFVIVSLAGVIMFTRSKLVATGDVTIIVNDDPDKALVTAAGLNVWTSCSNRWHPQKLHSPATSANSVSV